MTDKQPMQADGAGTSDAADPQESRKPKAEGESQGGAYPNPHSGKKPGGFDGGQSERAYHGSGRLGEEKTGEQPNAGSSE
ncbi:hypothetical protein F1C10_06330 [Sphingomonas sp. NBWT7]|uniref:hypothetical protein n=1 Tax=Sphingomonas sp. NBWT7 TaxID=2596913 RepID=UPI00162A94AE|nr:hypothetical protein [Sphingomonas sp. NBWT7]QNE31583.1 hypothetical protein F1C10_06330 [Sphingomonas sp. NBWT7]